MIWIILYFLIGPILGFIYYAWKCYKYKNKYKNKSWKLTWDEYDNKENVTITLVICIFLWPVLTLTVLAYLIFVCPTVYIRKYFGIE